MTTVPPATIAALLYRPPMKVTNNTTINDPMSMELGMSADLVDGSLNCLSNDGMAEFAIPFTANPSMKHIMETKRI